MAAPPSGASPWPALQGHTYLNLTTFRRSGEPVVTPLWFAEHDGRLYVTTQVQSGKVKRIRHTPRVLVGPADMRGRPLGPTVEAIARVLPPEAHAAADAHLDRKYGLLKRAIRWTRRLPGRQSTFLEITPA